MQTVQEKPRRRAGLNGQRLLNNPHRMQLYEPRRPADLPKVQHVRLVTRRRTTKSSHGGGKTPRRRQFLPARSSFSEPLGSLHSGSRMDWLDGDAFQPSSSTRPTRGRCFPFHEKSRSVGLW